MSNSLRIRKIAGIGILLALVVVFQLIGNYVSIGPISFNLSLVIIALGAILYGPIAGLVLGMADGLIVLFGPSTQPFYQAGFMVGGVDLSVLATIIICLVKTGVAGLVAGFIFKLFKGKLLIPGMFIIALIIPIINTGLFTIGAFTVFKQLFVSYAQGQDLVKFYLTAVLGINFIVEFIISLILSPSVVYVIKIITRNYNIGDNIGEQLLYWRKEEIKEDEPNSNV